MGAGLAALAMVLAGVVAHLMTPRNFLADSRGDIRLEAIIPQSFADWRIDPAAQASVVNPVQEATLKEIYSDILTRTYVNSNGQRVMLSVTYGRDQRADKAAHYPEVCYPAQGFTVRSNRVGASQVLERQMPVRRLETWLNTRRIEPVTYWTTVGEFASLGGLDRRLIELRYGLSGTVPDGMLFRVSTVGPDSLSEFTRQDDFIQALLSATAPKYRAMLTGGQVR